MHSELSKRLGWTLGVAVVGVMGLGAFPSHAEEVPPSVVFLLDNNESMQDFHQYLPEPQPGRRELLQPVWCHPGGL